MGPKLSVGDLTIHRIIEQETTFLPALEMLPTLTPELLAENRTWMQAAKALDANDVLVLCFQSYVVKTPHHTILIDSCIGNDKPRPQRPKWNMKTDDTYARALAAARGAPGRRAERRRGCRGAIQGRRGRPLRRVRCAHRSRGVVSPRRCRGRRADRQPARPAGSPSTSSRSRPSGPRKSERRASATDSPTAEDVSHPSSASESPPTVPGHSVQWPWQKMPFSLGRGRQPGPRLI